MGQYRSRAQRKQQLKRAGGGVTFDDVVKTGRQVVRFVEDNPEVVEHAKHAANFVKDRIGGSTTQFAAKNPQLDRLFNETAKAAGEISEFAHHPSQHHPNELLKEAQRLVSRGAPEVAHEVLQAHHDYPEFSLINPFTTRFPDHSVNPMAHALAARKLYGVDRPKTNESGRAGGGLDFKSITSATEQMANTLNPASTVDKMMGNFDRVDLNDWSARGVAKNGLNLYAANLRGHAAYAQTTGLALTPGVALGAALPIAGFHATGVAFNGAADGVDTINRHI